MPAAVMPNTADWLTQLAGVPLPGRSQEEWRFTGLAALEALAPELWSGVDPFAQLSLPAGVSRIGSDEAQGLQHQVLKRSTSRVATLRARAVVKFLARQSLLHPHTASSNHALS